MAAPTDGVIVNITGTRVALGPLTSAHVPELVRWDNDWATTRTTTIPPQPISPDAYAAGFPQALTVQDRTPFIIYDRATMQPIGYTDLHRIDHRNRTAEFAIGIGEPDYRGKGYGTEVTTLMLDYAFTAQGLASVMLAVVAVNERGIRAYTRAGFREIGRRRQAWMLGGTLWDIIYMDCLASEFDSPQLRAFLVPE
jgi:diamine N-acetyltransferase